MPEFTIKLMKFSVLQVMMSTINTDTKSLEESKIKTYRPLLGSFPIKEAMRLDFFKKSKSDVIEYYD